MVLNEEKNQSKLFCRLTNVQVTEKNKFNMPFTFVQGKEKEKEIIKSSINNSCTWFKLLSF